MFAIPFIHNKAEDIKHSPLEYRTVKHITSSYTSEPSPCTLLFSCTAATITEEAIVAQHLPPLAKWSILIDVRDSDLLPLLNGTPCCDHSSTIRVFFPLIKPQHSRLCTNIYMYEDLQPQSPWLERGEQICKISNNMPIGRCARGCGYKVC